MYKQDLALNNLQGLIMPLNTISQPIYMDKQDLALDNPQGLICYKTQPTKRFWHLRHQAINSAFLSGFIGLSNWVQY